MNRRRSFMEINEGLTWHPDTAEELAESLATLLPIKRARRSTTIEDTKSVLSECLSISKALTERLPDSGESAWDHRSARRPPTETRDGLGDWDATDTLDLAELLEDRIAAGRRRNSTVEEHRAGLMDMSKALTEKIYGDMFDNEKGVLLGNCSTLLHALEKQQGTSADPLSQMDTLIKNIQRSYVDTTSDCTSTGYTKACPEWELYMPKAHELVEDPNDYDCYRHWLPNYVETRGEAYATEKSKTTRERSAALESLSSVRKALPAGASATIYKALHDNVGMFTDVQNTQTDLSALVSAYQRSSGWFSYFFGDRAGLQRHSSETKESVVRDLGSLRSAIRSGNTSALDPTFKQFCRSSLVRYTTQAVVAAEKERADMSWVEWGRRGLSTALSLVLSKV